MTRIGKLMIRAIDKCFSDTSVSQEATLEMLEEAQTELEFKIQSLRADIEREQRQGGGK